MTRIMVVTVGTSLFHSASWDAAHPGLRKVLGEEHWQNYDQYWCSSEEDQGLRSPSYRRRHDNDLETFFEEELTAQNAATWTKWLAPYDPLATLKMRYSAEIATILRFLEIEKDKLGTDWQDIVNSYKIIFVRDSAEDSPSYAAAAHSLHYLQQMFGQTESFSSEKLQYKSIEGFSGKVPKFLAEGLQEFQNFLINIRGERDPGYETIDIVISGGYKAYGMVGYGFLLQERFRVIYQHEKFKEVFIQDKDTLRVGKAPGFKFIPIISR